MKLSQQLEAMAARRIELGLYQQAELICAAAAVVKAVESAPVISIESPCLRDCLADAGFTPTHRGQRVALVPLPQQSET